MPGSGSVQHSCNFCENFPFKWKSKRWSRISLKRMLFCFFPDEHRKAQIQRDLGLVPCFFKFMRVFVKISLVQRRNFSPKILLSKHVHVSAFTQKTVLAFTPNLSFGDGGPHVPHRHLVSPQTLWVLFRVLQDTGNNALWWPLKLHVCHTILLLPSSNILHRLSVYIRVSLFVSGSKQQRFFCNVTHPPKRYPVPIGAVTCNLHHHNERYCGLTNVRRERDKAFVGTFMVVRHPASEDFNKTKCAQSHAFGDFQVLRSPKGGFFDRIHKICGRIIKTHLEALEKDSTSVRRCPKSQPTVSTGSPIVSPYWVPWGCRIKHACMQMPTELHGTQLGFGETPAPGCLVRPWNGDPTLEYVLQQNAWLGSVELAEGPECREGVIYKKLQDTTGYCRQDLSQTFSFFFKC